jgi:hypothetical protein
MEEVARLFARVLIADEDPASVKPDVHSLRADFQQVRYCFPE